MEKIGKVKEGQNCLIVSLSGDQSYVMIFNENNELIRHSQTKGATEIQHVVNPGEYRVETDGKIKRLSYKLIKFEAETDVTHPTNQ